MTILGDVEDTKKENPLDCTGIELLMLDQGRQFRKDLIERTQCLKLLVAVTILTCPTDDERAETLNKWIQIAVDAKTAAGNLFAFSAIMLGLCMPQVRFFDQQASFVFMKAFSIISRFKSSRRHGIPCGRNTRTALSTLKQSLDPR